MPFVSYFITLALPATVISERALLYVPISLRHFQHDVMGDVFIDR